MVELALFHESFERLDCRLDAVVGIDTRTLEEIESFLPIESFQDRVDAAAEVLWIRIGFKRVSFRPTL